MNGFAELLREGEGEEVEVTTPEPAEAETDDAALAAADARGPVGMLLALLGPVGGPPEEGETDAAGPLALLPVTEL